MPKKPYEMYLRQEEVISPKELLARRESGDPSVKKAEFVPPKPGDRHFGKFVIKYSSPTYVYK